MDEDEDDVQRVTSDADTARDALLSEWETYMCLPRSLRLLKEADLDSLLRTFGELLQWAHPDEDAR